MENIYNLDLPVTYIGLPEEVKAIICNRAAAISYVGFYFSTGSYNEPKSMEGISHLIEHLIFSCGDEKKRKAFYERTRELGASINAYTSTRVTCFYFTVLSKNLDEMVALLADVLANFDLTEEILQKEKEIVKQEIKAAQLNHWNTLDEKLRQAVFPYSKFSVPVIGYEKTVDSLTVEDVLTWYKTYYTKKNLTVVMVGDIHFMRRKHIQSLIDLLPEGEEKVIFPSKPPFIRKAHAENFFNGTLPQHLIKAFYAAPRMDFTYMQIASTLLGVGIGSYFWDKLREDRPIVYTLGSNLYIVDDETLLMQYYAGFNNPSDALYILDTFTSSLDYLLHITEKEFELAKDNILMGYYSAFEQAASIGSVLWDAYQRNLYVKDMEDIVDVVQQAGLNYFKHLVTLLQKETYGPMAYGILSSSPREEFDL